MSLHVMQSLESRILFAAVLTDGVLTITGTEGNDEISVFQLYSEDDGFISVEVWDNDAFVSFALSAVTQVVITAGEGNDRISSPFTPLRRPMLIDAGPGEDTVHC